MTIEINRNSEYTFRVNPDDPRQIDRRQNRHGAHWTFWVRRNSATEAKLALIKLGRQDDAMPKGHPGGEATP